MQNKNETATVAAAAEAGNLNVLGHSIRTLLTKQNTGGNYFVFECVSPPGLGIPFHLNRQGDAIAAILDGEYSVSIDDKHFTARKGDVCFFPHQVPHSFQNLGVKAGTTLWTIAPGDNFEAFFHALSNLPAGEPDPATVAKIFAANEMEFLHP